VDFENVDIVLERIENYYEQVNESIKELKVSIKKRYLNLKKQEVLLAHEYAKKLKRQNQDETDELNRLCEEKRLKEEKKKKVENFDIEEEKLKHDLRKYQSLLAITPQERKESINEHIDNTKAALLNIEKNRQFLTYVDSNTKAGFVYVLSNIGVYGEDVYHVGMTRSLEPLEAISSIGAGFLPYEYDVHALVFSTDAEGLKDTVVKKLAEYRINLVNTTRDFFRVTLDVIIAELRKKHRKPIEVVAFPKAEEYRISEKMRYKALHPDEEEEQEASEVNESTDASNNESQGENTEE
jgi:hypothetical protein